MFQKEEREPIGLRIEESQVGFRSRAYAWVCVLGDRAPESVGGEGLGERESNGAGGTYVILSAIKIYFSKMRTEKKNTLF